MNNMVIRLSLAAAAIIVIALLGLRFLPGMNVGGPHAPTPTPTPAVIGSLDDQASLAPGRYTVGAGISRRVSISVPSGWSASGNWVIKGPNGNDAPAGMAIRFYTVTDVVKNPSSYADGFVNPPPGPTAADLIQAIVAQPAWQASKPTNTSIDGNPGKHIRVTVPQDAEFDTRDGGAFYLFDGIWGWAPGQTFDLYIVDVGNERLIIDAFHYPGTTDDDVATQQAVVASVQIGSRP